MLLSAFANRLARGARNQRDQCRRICEPPGARLAQVWLPAFSASLSALPGVPEHSGVSTAVHPYRGTKARSAQK